MDPLAIQQVRSFNRIVAQGIGALDDHFLGRARPLGEARLIWEIGPDGAEVRELRGRLGLDSGYVSRVLRSLERQGLVVVRASTGDGRVRRVHLTRKGLRERAELDRRSDDVALRMLEPLSESQRTTLVEAMTRVEQLLQACMVRFAIEDPTTPDARWCIEQYFAEIDARFDGGFDPAISTLPDARELTPPVGLFLVARLRNRPVGCGALKFHRDAPPDIKRMWIAPEARGIGLGRRLLHELEQHAHDAGASVVRLETNRSLREAIALYRRSGYVEVEPFNDELYAHHWFEKRLV
jgi:DNA-binding MarR family transcriptional regulator/N-acetylglutamate synthase-like GNAT family acetyltransferase